MPHSIAWPVLFEGVPRPAGSQKVDDHKRPEGKGEATQAKREDVDEVAFKDFVHGALSSCASIRWWGSGHIMSGTSPFCVATIAHRSAFIAREVGAKPDSVGSSIT
jgi:hypothetical protein